MRQCGVRYGNAGEVGSGKVRRDPVGFGVATQRRRGLVRSGQVGIGPVRSGPVGPGKVGRGNARQARCGRVRWG